MVALSWMGASRVAAGPRAALSRTRFRAVARAQLWAETAAWGPATTVAYCPALEGKAAAAAGAAQVAAGAPATTVAYCRRSEAKAAAAWAAHMPAAASWRGRLGFPRAAITRVSARSEPPAA